VRRQIDRKARRFLRLEELLDLVRDLVRANGGVHECLFSRRPERVFNRGVIFWVAPPMAIAIGGPSQATGGALE
jgi:hypothetical protein